MSIYVANLKNIHSIYQLDVLFQKKMMPFFNKKEDAIDDEAKRFLSSPFPPVFSCGVVFSEKMKKAGSSLVPPNALDMGGYEMGFNPATQSCRERDILDLDSLASPQVLRNMHDREMPHTLLTEHQFNKHPTRHAPWKSEAERVMLASEMSMSASMTRNKSFRSSDCGNSRGSPSPTFKPSSRSSSRGLPFSPVYVGRPGTSDLKMQNSSFYAKVAKSVDRKSVSKSLFDRDNESDVMSISSQQSTSSSIPKPAQSPQLKHLMSNNFDNSVETERSPYARFDLISQQFTNPVVQDLWIEVRETYTFNNT